MLPVQVSVNFHFLYVHGMHQVPETIPEFCQRMRKDIMGIRNGGQLVSESSVKADILNHQFESVFTNENPIVNLPTQQVHSPMPKIVVSEVGVFKLLSDQDEKKAPGADGVSARQWWICKKKQPSMWQHWRTHFVENTDFNTWIAGSHIYETILFRIKFSNFLLFRVTTSKPNEFGIMVLFYNIIAYS